MWCNILPLTVQPTTNSSRPFETHIVELPDENSIVSAELECDIQPGALRERCSVQWKQLQHTDTFYNNSFHVSLISVNGSQYQCEVTIDHDDKFKGAPYCITYKENTIVRGMQYETLYIAYLYMYSKSYTIHFNSQN